MTDAQPPSSPVDGDLVARLRLKAEAFDRIVTARETGDIDSTFAAVERELDVSADQPTTGESCPTCGKVGADTATLDHDSGRLEADCGDEWHDRQVDGTAGPGTAAPGDGGLVARLREHADRVAGGGPGDATYDPETLALEHEAADEIERLRELTSGEDFLIDAQADVIAGLQAEIERLRAALSLTVAALDDILRRAWLDCHPGRPAKAMLNPADLSSWESWQTTLAETREVLGDE